MAMESSSTLSAGALTAAREKRRGDMSRKRWKAAFWAVVVLVPLALLFALNVAQGPKQIEKPIESAYSVADAQFPRAMSALLGPPLVGGNSVRALQNGDQIFPAMLDAIRSAQRSITFETFIYWSGRVGRDFTEALSDRARAGVQVHVILDAMGIDRIDEDFITRMEGAGVKLVRYRPVHWYTLARLNNRTHRKLLVVDGRVAFTGGVGIADIWLGNAEAPGRWRDSHFRIEGPVVAQMQAAFNDNWTEADGGVLHDDRYFPALDSAGPLPAQAFMSSNDGGAELVRMMYLMSIAAARRRIEIANAYFVPDDMARDMLVDARRRGVEIDIIVPGPIMDARVTRRASRSRWGPLLEAGVRIHEYQPTMFHSKVMVVDGRWVTVGSTNFDNRSFRLNDELNLNVYDSAFAAEQSRVFAQDLRRARLVTLAAWRQRPFAEKLKERLAGLLRSQL